MWAGWTVVSLLWLLCVGRKQGLGAGTAAECGWWSLSVGQADSRARWVGALGLTWGTMPAMPTLQASQCLDCGDRGWACQSSDVLWTLGLEWAKLTNPSGDSECVIFFGPNLLWSINCCMAFYPPVISVDTLMSSFLLQHTNIEARLNEIGVSTDVLRIACELAGVMSSLTFWKER